MKARLFPNAAAGWFCMSLAVAMMIPLQGCSWFRKGGSAGDRGLVQLPAEYDQDATDATTGTAERPADAPRELERPRGLRPAGDRMLVIYFDYDSSELRPDQLARLDTNLRYLLDEAETKVLIEGHCDERGTTEYNFALGERRARSVADYFIRNGVDASRVQVLSKGEEEPVALGHNEEAWRLNRRAEFKFFD
jgi:peptidoglycan-associated lipoprotein